MPKIFHINMIELIQSFGFIGFGFAMGMAYAFNNK